MTVLHQTLGRADNRLGRRVEHDSRSRDYAVTAEDVSRLRSIRHVRHVPVFDQGQIGSCTANAAIGCLGTGDFYAAIGRTILTADAAADERYAVSCYSDEQRLLGFGPYPPSDRGGSGLAIAKVLKKRSLIPGYRHAFSLAATLTALSKQPVIIGIPWYTGMFTPDLLGQVHPTGTVAGGHEIVLDQIDVEKKRAWFTNSWGTSWGIAGRGWFSFDDLGTLLSQQGDCTVLTIPTAVTK